MTEPLKVTYRTPLDGELRAAMVAQLVKYLLFMRGQIPCLYDELFKFVATFQLQQQRGQGERPKKRRLPMSGGIKKALKCVEAAELLFGAQLDAVFALQVQRVALVFGSSLMSPREVVIVDFNDIEAAVVGGDSSPTSAASPQTDHEEASLDDSQMLTPPSPPMTRDKLMHLCAQKLLRALFTQSMEHFSSALPTTKLHVAVLAERQPTRISGFIPKQQFKLRLPKDKRGSRTHYIEIYDGADHRNEAPQVVAREPTAKHTEIDCAVCAASEPPLTSGRVNHDMMWYVLEKPLPGFSEIIGTGDEKKQGATASQTAHLIFELSTKISRMQQSPTAFASLEERIAHLNWRKVCNERQIQGTLRHSKQLQERDEFIRAAKSGNKLQRERMQQVIKDEFSKPLPVTAQFYHELTALQREDELKAQSVAERHMTQLHNIQTKLDAREAQLVRKKEFERKKKELFAHE